jgi:hypothetical protein
MDKTIIAVVGYAGSGKDTVGDYISSKYLIKKFSFARPIKEVCKIIFGWTDKHVYGDLKEIVDSEWGVSPREALQWLGTDIFQYAACDRFPKFKELVGRHTWVRRFAMEFLSTGYKAGVITDCRFVMEHDYLKELSVKENIKIAFIRVHRKIDHHDPKYSHASEKDIGIMPVDYEIDNNGTLEDLYRRVDEVMLNVQS